jgi:hypothetical protein
MNHQKCFRAGNCTVSQSSVATHAGSKRLNRSFLRRKVARLKHVQQYTATSRCNALWFLLAITNGQNSARQRDFKRK